MPRRSASAILCTFTGIVSDEMLCRILSSGDVAIDTVFLRQLTRRGCKMVWCGEAVAWGSVPADRSEADYLLCRAFRGAQTTTFVCTTVTPRKLGRALKMDAGCLQVALYGPAGKALKHERWLRVMAKGLGGLGKLFWHPSLHLRMYR